MAASRPQHLCGPGSQQGRAGWATGRQCPDCLANTPLPSRAPCSAHCAAYKRALWASTPPPPCRVQTEAWRLGCLLSMLTAISAHTCYPPVFQATTGALLISACSLGLPVLQDQTARGPGRAVALFLLLFIYVFIF